MTKNLVNHEEVTDAMAMEAAIIIKAANTIKDDFGDKVRQFMLRFCADTLTILFEDGETDTLVDEDTVSDAMAREAIFLHRMAMPIDEELANTIKQFLAIYCARILADLFPEEEEEER